MSPVPAQPDAQTRSHFGRFLAGQTDERLFTWPLEHPALSTAGFCYCDWPWHRRLVFLVRAGLAGLAFALPWSGLKAWTLRRLGARVGQRVAISPGVWIDFLYPQLLTIEDEVFIGAGAKITLHDSRVDEFRAGKVILRRGAMIGGSSLIGCGIEVGERATIAGGAVVGRDVPAGATAIGNPARIVRRQDKAADVSPTPGARHG